MATLLPKVGLDNFCPKLFFPERNSAPGCLGPPGVSLGRGGQQAAQSRCPAGVVSVTGAQLGAVRGDGGQFLLPEEGTTGLTHAYPR